MEEPTFSGAVWRKSSHSGSSGGECVEVALLVKGNAVRDSKDPAGAVLALERDAWAAIVSQIKQGAYDL
ncbi:DUF397 domain-containing protein [Actinomadura chokoriensis]|uniref:DUF397 domain-containing protein n=1 Tax=Actinomadura chokoriensis TaxID=454156 RepID=A0ABV4R7W8_9ACTN